MARTTKSDRNERVAQLAAEGIETAKGQCDVCGRDLPPSSGGRPRLRHRECTIIMSQIATLEGLTQVVRFKGPLTVQAVDKKGRKFKKLDGHAKALRAELLRVTRTVQAYNVKASTSSADQYEKYVDKRAGLFS